MSSTTRAIEAVIVCRGHINTYMTFTLNNNFKIKFNENSISKNRLGVPLSKILITLSIMKEKTWIL